MRSVDEMQWLLRLKSRIRLRRMNEGCGRKEMLATGCGVTNEGESGQEVLREGRVACAICGGRAVYDWLTRGGVDGRCVIDVDPRIGGIAQLEAA